MASAPANTIISSNPPNPASRNVRLCLWNIRSEKLDADPINLAACSRPLHTFYCVLPWMTKRRQSQTIYFWDGFAAASTMAFRTGISFSGGAVLLKLRIYA